MKFLKNEKGISLVEAMIGIGISAAAGVAYMTHVQNTAKNEARQKIRNSITQLESQATDYLKSRDVCNSNLAKAFKDVPMRVDGDNEIKGKSSYKVLKNKDFTDSNGNVTAKDIFKEGDVFDGGRIYVNDVKYAISELADINIPKAPWSKSGKIRIGVEFQFCRNNAAVFNKSPNGVLTASCPVEMRQSVMKYYDKLVAFKTDPGTDLITEQTVREQVLNPLTGKLEWKAGNKKKAQLTCADSQDALLDAANSYTDEKVCLLDVRLQAQLGREGKTSCDYEVKLIPRTLAYTGSRSGELIFPTIFAPGSAKLRMIGAGGGGAGGWKSAGGLGGQAGQYIEQTLPDQLMGEKCAYNVAGPTPHVGRQTDGRKGGNTALKCPNKNIDLVAQGGVGGHRKGDDTNSGGDGASSPFGAGGAGGRYNSKHSESGKPGGIGAGGGGGTSDNKGRDGGAGGAGNIEIKWLEVQVLNPEGILIDLDGNPI